LPAAQADPLRLSGRAVAAGALAPRNTRAAFGYGLPKCERYSIEEMKAFTISARM
jgi:hypothetical protein